MKDEIQFLIAIAAIKKVVAVSSYVPRESIVGRQKHFVMFQIWHIMILLCN